MVSGLRYYFCLGLQCYSRCEPSQMLYYDLQFSIFSVYFLSFAFISPALATSLPIKHNFPHSNKHDFIKTKHEPKHSQSNALRSIGKTASLNFHWFLPLKANHKVMTEKQIYKDKIYISKTKKMQWSNLLYNLSKSIEDSIRTANFKYITYNTLLNNIHGEHGFSDICTSAPRKK